ncbi:MAG: SUMF1/EgtB/PvdO family nonheme iron enzyme [Spirochaetales bacterium]|nr:SUMF1/EgtB/PvdO family nonheme iron enzyme [Spirochaetales bacterium]
MFKKVYELLIVSAIVFAVVVLGGCDPKPDDEDELLKKNTYTVTFNLDGGERTGGGEVSQVVKHGEGAVAPVAVKTGYSLSWDRGFSNITQATSVKAVWSINSYTVTFDLDGGELTGGELVQSVEYGCDAVAPEVSKSGFTFVGWDNSFSNITGDLAVKTIWGYTVTFDISGGEHTGGGELVQVIESGNAAVVPEVINADCVVSWNKAFDNITGDLIVIALWTQEYSTIDLSFNMKQVPVPNGGISFPTGIPNNVIASIDYVYQIGEIEVTWKLWKTVYDWATSSDRGSNRYYFQNPGIMGSNSDGINITDLHPVTRVSWRDSMVWCNAITQWYNAMTGSSLEPVYRYEGSIVRDSRDATACDDVVATDNNGFRLPTSQEWELAARWRTNLTNTVDGYSNPWFTKGDSASGATGNYNNSTTNKSVAWYESNSDDRTHPVAEKQENSLGIYDMSGNVWEWLFPKYFTHRQRHGGSWSYSSEELQIGKVISSPPGTLRNDNGFRLFRTP